ncbi:MAG TPA: hypothetical protein DCY56_06820 [Candidatus Omnitrophica bacterium]|nr:hypothetical protein [Candidatus Omnitrophota bacterium]
MEDLRDFREKYRPKTLDEVWGNEHIKIIWNGYRKKGFFPHSIILSSNFGLGKTTLARIFAKDIIECEGELSQCIEYMEFNSPECDYATINKMLGKFRGFSCSVLMPRVLFFDEAHRMPDKAQDGFLKPIEDINFLTFIFATSDLNRIDGGLLSRSDKYFLKPPPNDVLISKLSRISELERIKIEKNVFEFLIERSNFCPRDCLGNLEILSNYEGVIDLQIAKEFLTQ